VIEILKESLSTILGGSLGVIGGLLFLFALRRMAAHAVLLHGSVVLPDESSANASSIFRFRLQNLEQVAFPSPLRIRFLCRSLYGEATFPEPKIRVFAGPKRVILDPEDNPPSSQERHFSYRRSLYFEDLPPFDTWQFELEGFFAAIEMKVVVGKPAKTSGLRLGLTYAIAPSKLELSRKHPQGAVEGASFTPSYLMFGLIAGAAVVACLSASISMAGDPYSLSDAMLDVGSAFPLAFVLWLGFNRIRRPVYPVIQGYLDETTLLNGAADRTFSGLPASPIGSK
jgi:hypothetical protein